MRHTNLAASSAAVALALYFLFGGPITAMPIIGEPATVIQHSGQLKTGGTVIKTLRNGFPPLAAPLVYVREERQIWVSRNYAVDKYRYERDPEGEIFMFLRHSNGTWSHVGFFDPAKKEILQWPAPAAAGRCCRRTFRPGRRSSAASVISRSTPMDGCP